MARSTHDSTGVIDPSRHGGPADDITEWLDWDHWQRVDELQTIVDGLANPTISDATEDVETADEAARRHLLRRLQRNGFELEG